MSRITDEMLEEVRAEVSRKGAARMLKKKYPTEMIAEWTGLSLEEEEKLKVEISSDK